MSDELRTMCRPRARPVDETPIQVLLARVDELAKRWVIALIVMRPLERIGEIPLADLAREAPILCGQVLRALASDAELDRVPAVARRLDALAGARDVGAAMEAVEALRGVLWEALMDELRWLNLDRSPARLVADLADRLASICAIALDAIIHADLEAGSDDGIDGGFEWSPPGPGGLAVPPGAGASTAADPSGSGPSRPPSGGGRTILVDERQDVLGQAPQELVAERQRAGPPPWQRSPPEMAPGAPFAPAGRPPLAPRRDVAPPAIEIRDERVEEGPTAWIRSIGAQLERFERDGLPFVVLLVEISSSSDASRVWQGIAREVEEMLVQELRPSGAREEASLTGSITRERPGRYWLLAPNTSGIGARALAERITRVVRLLASRREAPVEVAVGTAVCPEDGRGAAVLAAHADIGLFAARADARASAGRPTSAGWPGTPVDEPV